MRGLKSFLLLAVIVANMDDLLSITFYDSHCSVQAHYVAESIDIKSTGEITLHFTDGRTLEGNLKYHDIMDEVQISMGRYFRSYKLEDGIVVEHKEPVCKGAV